MMKKIAVLTLSILTACAVLAGCGSDDKKSSTTSSKTSSKADSSTVSGKDDSNESSTDNSEEDKNSENDEDNVSDENGKNEEKSEDGKKSDAENEAEDDNWGSEGVADTAKTATDEISVAAEGIWVLMSADADMDKWTAKYSDMPESSVVQFQLEADGKGKVIGLAVDGKECPLTWSEESGDAVKISIDSSSDCDISGDYTLKMNDGMLETDEMLDASCKFNKESDFSLYDYDELKGLISGDM